MRVSEDAVVTGAVTGLVGLLTALASWWSGHKQGQSSFITAVHQAAHIVIEDLQHELERSRADAAALRADHARQHEQCQADLARMQAQIDALMRGPPASY